MSCKCAERPPLFLVPMILCSRPKSKPSWLLNEQVKALNIEVITEDSVVYLMGTVDRASATEPADIASASSGVRKVVKVLNISTNQISANKKALF